MSSSQEEEIARDFICFGNPDVTVVVVDATCLERNLNLVYQILELTQKVIVCVNLLDEAKKKGITIDLNRLSFLLGVPVVGTIARKKKTLKNLLNAIYNVASGKVIPIPKLVRYPDKIENCLDIITNSINNILPKKYKYISRWISLKLVDNDEKIINSIKSHIKYNLFTDDIYNKLSLSNEIIGDLPDFRNTIVYSIIKKSSNIVSDVVDLNNNTYKNRDKKLDRILTSKTFGIPIMLLFLCIIFWITIIGANFPSQFLFNIFKKLEVYLSYRFKLH